MFRSPSRVPARRQSARGRWFRLSLALTLVLLLTGCATFQDNGPRAWRDQPQNGGSLISPPQAPNQAPDSPKPPPPPGQQSGPKGCVDPDPQVVATCLNPVSAIAVLPDAQSALVAERSTGRILRVQKGKQPQLVATVPVDATGGGLIGLVLSPSFDEDQLLYAYAATPTDHRVLRVPPDSPPVPILTGIPRTPGDDSGGMAVGRDGALLVATGSGGANPAPDSLAGKVLRIDTFGHPFKDNPDPRSPIYTGGLSSPSGMCIAFDSGIVWLTDNLADRDVLQQVTPGRLGDPAWNWPDKPGVSGCVAPKGGIAVAERNGSALFLLNTSGPTTFTGTAQTALAGVYGRLGTATLAPDGLIWLGTVNKGLGGKPGPTDDRAIRLFVPAGANGSGPD